MASKQDTYIHIARPLWQITKAALLLVLLAQLAPSASCKKRQYNWGVYKRLKRLLQNGVDEDALLHCPQDLPVLEESLRQSKKGWRMFNMSSGILGRQLLLYEDVIYECQHGTRENAMKLWREVPEDSTFHNFNEEWSDQEYWQMQDTWKSRCLSQQGINPTRASYYYKDCLMGANTTAQSQEAYICIAMGAEKYVENCLTLAYGIRQHDESRDFVLMFRDIDISAFSNLFSYLNVRPVEVLSHHVIRGADDITQPYKVVQHIKFKAWLLTDYRKVLYMDSDMLPISDPQSIFRYPEGSGVEGLSSPMNGGLILMEPRLRGLVPQADLGVVRRRQYTTTAVGYLGGELRQEELGAPRSNWDVAAQIKQVQEQAVAQEGGRVALDGPYDFITALFRGGSYSQDMGWNDAWPYRFKPPYFYGGEQDQGTYYYYFRYISQQYHLLPKRFMYIHRDVRAMNNTVGGGQVVFIHFLGRHCGKPDKTGWDLSTFKIKKTGQKECLDSIVMWKYWNGIVKGLVSHTVWEQSHPAHVLKPRAYMSEAPTTGPVDDAPSAMML